MTAWRSLVWVGFKTSRPSQLLLIVGVYALGVKIALVSGGTASASRLMAGLTVLVPIAASVHQVNEYADYETDAMTQRTPFSGGSGALQASGLSRKIALQSGTLLLAVGTGLTAGFLFGGLLSVTDGLLAACIAVFGWQYSLGPLALVRRGLGELDNALLGGLVLPLYGGSVARGPLGLVALASVPFTLVVFLNLLAVHWPDRNADAAVGKQTLVVRWSPQRLRRVYTLTALAAGLALLVLSPQVLPWPVTAASFTISPLVVWGRLGYTHRHTPWPTVTAMVGLAVVQFLAWCWL